MQGNYNATADNTLADPHVPAAIIADAVTLLSNNWNDIRSFRIPPNPANRPATTTGYRVAIVGGKSLPFPRPTGWASAQDFGTDGGAHNFLRLLEGWDNGSTLNYRGSIVSFFTSRQAVGSYKCCTNVYAAPTRGFNFDTRLPDAVAASAGHADVPRRQHADVPAAVEADAVVGSRESAVVSRSSSV